MKFHLEQTTGYRFTGHGAGYVEINRQRYQSSLLVLADQLVEGWGSAGFDALTTEDFAALLAYQPEIVLLGSGSIQRFPHPRLLAPLLAARIGIEVMDTPAACRTFNILTSEDRRVAAAILI